MEQGGFNKNPTTKIIICSAIFILALAAFVITVTVKTNLEAINKDAVYKILYVVFMLICLLPNVILFINAIVNKAYNIKFVTALTALSFISVIFVYSYGHTVPQGTENIFQYATVKLYKQHFRYVLITLMGVAFFGNLIYAVTLIKLKVKDLIYYFTLTFLYLVAFIVNLCLAVKYQNYVHAVSTLITDLCIVLSAVILTILPWVLKRKIK